MNKEICNNFHENCGSACQGRKGTGKTESSKDLVNMLGMRYVVCNANGLEIDRFKTIIKGSILTGNWVIFDEFWRFNPKDEDKIYSIMKEYFSACSKGLDAVNIDGE